MKKAVEAPLAYQGKAVVTAGRELRAATHDVVARLTSLASGHLFSGENVDTRWRRVPRFALLLMKSSTLCVVAFLAASLLVGCSKLRLGNDADAAADAGVAAPVATASTPVATASATAEASADPKHDPGGCKPGQLSVKLTEVPGGVESQKCRQVCGQGRGQCPSGQACTGSATPNGPLVCVNVKPGAGSCKPGDRLIQGSAITLFFCVTPCKADSDCPKQRPVCNPELNEDLNNPALKFRSCEEASIAAPSKAAATTPSAATTPTPTQPPPPAAKVKCVLPSPPPCAAPHVASPKGLCQLPCSNGSCAACGGTCQNGFCAGG